MQNKIGICKCRHTQQEHKNTLYEKGHGACNKCKCPQFTWVKWQDKNPASIQLKTMCALCRDEKICTAYEGQDLDSLSLCGDQVALYGDEEIYICDRCWKENLKPEEYDGLGG